MNPELTHDRYKELSTIDDVKIDVVAGVITINYITNEIFIIDINKKPYNLLIVASQYLGCDCRFQINGREVMFT